MWQLFVIDLEEVIVYYQQPGITMDSDIDFRLQTFLGRSRALLLISQKHGNWQYRHFNGCCCVFLAGCNRLGEIDIFSAEVNYDG